MNDFTKQTPEPPAFDFLEGAESFIGNTMANVDTGKSLVELANEPIDESEILVGNKSCRWLERVHVCMMSAPAGTGKSHVASQLAVGWAQGESVFGFEPVQPLRCLIVQGENPPNDSRSIAANMLRGFTHDQLGLVHENTRQVWKMAVTGNRLIQELSRTADKWNPDVLFLDPLLSFAPGPLTDPEVVQNFCRQGLSGFAEKYRCALFITNHVPKPSQGKGNGKPGAYDLQYQASGNADLVANWPRSTLGLHPLARGEFLLKAGKRRPPWKNADGETVWEIGLRHTDEGRWETFDAGSVEAVNDTKGDAEALASMARKQPYKLGDLRDLATETFRAGRGRRAFDLLRESLNEFGLTVQQAKHKGACFIGTRIDAEQAARKWDEDRKK